MNSLQANKKSDKKPKIVVDNPLESLKSVGDGITHEVKQASTDAIKDMWAQILGVDRYANKPKPKMHGDLQPGQAVDLKAAQEKKPTSQAEAPSKYFQEIRELGQTTLQKENQEIKQQVQALVYELQRLATSSKAIEKEVAMATSNVVNPGKYHASFFEWMLSVVKDARKRVENSGAWLKTVKRKKGMMIGKMKKNMNELMSGERSVSNQTG